MIPYSEPYVFTSLTSGSQPESDVRHVTPALSGHSLAAVRDWPCLRGYLCIYDFTTPMRSSWYSCALVPFINPCELSSCLHNWNILSQKSLIDSSVKGQYTTWLVKQSNFFHRHENINFTSSCFWDQSRKALQHPQ